MSNRWIFFATGDNVTYSGQTTVDNTHMLFRAVSKWLVRKSGSKLTHEFWEYVDQYDNDLENALIDQFFSQAESTPKVPEITNVKSRDYSIDMIVTSKVSSESYKSCVLKMTLFVYFPSIKKKMRMSDVTINISMLQVTGNIEKIVVRSHDQTPAISVESRGSHGKMRVKKRLSKLAR